MQREKQKEFKASPPELFGRYPKFSKALAKVLDTSDEIKPAATEEQIGNQESVLDFTLPSQVREFFQMCIRDRWSMTQMLCWTKWTASAL